MLKIGSHVSMSGKDMLLGSVNEAISYGATTFMFYTGAPQNTARKPVSALKVEEAKQRMSEAGISIEDLVVHAPYIINLANTIKEETFELAVRFLKEEIQRCEDIGAVRLVLHPGSHVKAGEDVGLNQIVKGLNMVLTPDSNVKIALETMAGKGSELGYNIDQIKYMIDNVEHSHLLGICLDTCHLHDSGYDLNDFDSLLDEIDNKIGLERILAIHINDSKNTQGARKDRHENIGHGYIGFELLNTIVNHPRLTDVPKILETPYIDGKAPYKEEIEMFRTQTFTNIKD